jgi:hypothetical protein
MLGRGKRTEEADADQETPDNVTNTPMFADPDLNSGALSFGATNFGQITGLHNGVGPRNMQFSVKLYF